MNCPACGAPNEVDAQFCAECGSSLENNDIEATIAGQKLPVDSEPAGLATGEPVTAPEPDTSDDVPVAAETITIDQVVSSTPTTVPEADDQPVIDEALRSPIEDEPGIPEPPETVAPAAEPPSEKPPAEKTAGDSQKMWFIVGGVALLIIIICCCCSVFVGAVFGMLSSEAGQEILREISAISVNWPMM